MTVAIPKYRAKHVYWDDLEKHVIGFQDVQQFRIKNRLQLPKHIWRFDSQHEFKVYLELVRMYGKDAIKRQWKVDIYNPSWCYPNGKTWKADFAICFPDSDYNYDFLVEAKGAFTREFAHTLAALENKDQDIFDSLYIVFSLSIPNETRVINSLLNTPFRRRLLTLKNLKKLTQLP